MFADVEEIGLAERGNRRQKMGDSWVGWDIGVLGRGGREARCQDHGPVEIGALPVSRLPQSHITDLLSNYLLVFSIEGT